MAIFPIRTWGDLGLTTPAQGVTEFDDALRRLVDDMFETMYDAPGVGLAAPQIGVTKRLFVFDVGEGQRVAVNPELVETEGEWEFDEGCLSIPEKFWPLQRPSFARIRATDLDGEPVEYAGDELLGRVLQHEIDHLDGILILDRLPRRIRKEALRQLRSEAMGLTEA